MISHGAARFLKERLMDVSDKYRIFVCDICGLICESNLQQNTFSCRGCEKRGQPYDKVSQVYVPYASKLLFQELMALMIAPSIKTHHLKR